MVRPAMIETTTVDGTVSAATLAGRDRAA